MTLCLERLTLREIHLPLVEPFRTAGGVVDQRRVLLAELRDRDGQVAWSECVAESRPSYSPETVDSCWLALTEWVGPAVLGVEFAMPLRVDAALRQAVRGNQMARATVEMGCWALESSRRGIPLASLLAESAGALPRAQVETGIALGFQDSDAALRERVRAAVSDGYRRVKVKIEPGRDVGTVTAARDAAGDVAVTADANCSYSLGDARHVAALRRLDALGLAMIEQPLAHDDLVRHAELQRMLRTPLCLDESIRDAASVASMIALGSARVVNVKPGRVGGFAESLAIHTLCTAAGIPLWCGGMLETGIGRAYNVALASLPGFTQAGDLSPSARYWAQDIVTPAWTMDDHGRVDVPLQRAGLGVDVDVARIDALTVRSVTLDAR